MKATIICCNKCKKIIAYILGDYAGYYLEGEYCPKCYEKVFKK